MLFVAGVDTSDSSLQNNEANPEGDLLQSMQCFIQKYVRSSLMPKVKLLKDLQYVLAVLLQKICLKPDIF